MRRTILLLAFLLPASIAAQTAVTISPQQCLWRAGDDPAWAAQNLDETGWQPFAQWHPGPYPVRIWLRCRAGLSALGSISDPEIQVDLHSPYELYLNGSRIGAAGDLASGSYNLDSIRSWPVRAEQLATGPSLLALRFLGFYRFRVGSPMFRFFNSVPAIRAGDRAQLDLIRAATIHTRQSTDVWPLIYYSIIGVLAMPMLALYLFDRSRTPLLLLAVACLCMAILRINEFLVASMFPLPIFVCALLFTANQGMIFTQYAFFYSIGKGRVPAFAWAIVWLIALTGLPIYLAPLLGAYSPAWLISLEEALAPAYILLQMVFSLAPLHAFYPYRSLSKRMRPVALLTIAWGLVYFVWFAVQATATRPFGVPNYFAHWSVQILNVRGLVVACLLAALMGFLFREQRQITEDRAMLAGEMQAASEIQRMLAPAVIETAPGLRIEVAFHPMREVGGDFYLCRVLSGGRQRVMVGDVSGKGAAAAMAATLLLGGAAARDSDSPAQLLDHLNRVLRESKVGGLATCLCADVAADGAVTVANAGHLPPYFKGEEMKIESGFPLGVSDNTEYLETRVDLAPGDALTLLSDGVVEARNAAGELFGFERAARLSTEPAEKVAQTAQAFGQDDDITVLTLKFAGVPVHA
jgi:hypothetical protein